MLLSLVARIELLKKKKLPYVTSHIHITSERMRTNNNGDDYVCLVIMVKAIEASKRKTGNIYFCKFLVTALSPWRNDEV